MNIPCTTVIPTKSVTNVALMALEQLRVIANLHLSTSRSTGIIYSQLRICKDKRSLSAMNTSSIASNRTSSDKDSPNRPIAPLVVGIPFFVCKGTYI